MATPMRNAARIGTRQKFSGKTYWISIRRTERSSAEWWLVAGGWWRVAGGGRRAFFSRHPPPATRHPLSRIRLGRLRLLVFVVGFCRRHGAGSLDRWRGIATTAGHCQEKSARHTHDQQRATQATDHSHSPARTPGPAELPSP